jgi:hypothetical protein
VVHLWHIFFRRKKPSYEACSDRQTPIAHNWLRLFILPTLLSNSYLRMGVFLSPWTAAITSIITATASILLRQYWSRIPLKATKETSFASTGVTESVELRDDTDELQNLKLLYYQLHNLEEFPEVLPTARTLLFALLTETSTAAKSLPEHESILSVRSFSRRQLEEFQHRRDRNIGREWEQYNLGRKAGGSRELFGDREEAIWWLRQIAPVKYVDGAWLGHVGKVTAPFGLHKTLKGAWQILSEELGDGDLEKNHVHMYYELLQGVSPGLPAADDVDFGHPRHQLNELPVWKSAIAQLLVSLFTNEFLPEILGFNLHFEAVSMDTLKASKELKEVGIDPYYFILHVSIDNAHSGHTAIALEVVCEYMDYVQRTEGEEAVHQAWKRLQAGYLLSSGLPGTAIPPTKRSVKSHDITFNPTEMEVARIFKAKAHVEHGIHCSSKVKIGARTVSEWLDPAALESELWQKSLLNALSNSKFWVCRGDSSKSRFIQEMQWNGRMFGSFTQDEYSLLKRWIDGLPSLSPSSGDGEPRFGIERNILSGYPVFQPAFDAEFSTLLHPTTTLFSYQNLPTLRITNRPIIQSLLPLWLSHPCLLQAFVSIPFKTKTKVACAVVKMLRAQGGFDIEQECVAGMSEVRRPNQLGLVGIGMNMMQDHGLSLDIFPTLRHVLHTWPSEFAVNMLHTSTRPTKYRGRLIGMATAFSMMHDAMVRCESSVLSIQDKETLRAIAHRELECLRVCWEELETDGDLYKECCEGYQVAKHEIEKSFEV